MKHLIIAFFLLLIAADQVKAQQDHMFTQYMFNSLIFNPAYAGSRDFMSIGLIHRSQWLGFDQGTPSTQAFSIHTPLRNERIGLGLSVFKDAIGPTDQINTQASYAYRFPVGAFGHLALGLQGGVKNWRLNHNELEQKDPNDPAFSETGVESLWLPNFGAGVYFSTPSIFFGVSAPHLLDPDLRRTQITSDTIKFAREYRHYYLTGGIAIEFSNNVIFRPSILVKNVGLFGEFKEQGLGTTAPTVFDIDAAFLFNDLLWVGIALRSAFDGGDVPASYDSIDFWTQLHLKNGFRIGFAYDYIISNVSKVSSGSIEAMVGYEFNYEKSKIVTPRYF